MKRGQIIFIVIILVFIAAVFTNPNQSQHRDAIKQKLNEYIQKNVRNEGALSLMIGTAFLERVIDTIVSSDNYLVFSLTKATWQGESSVVGIGIFGNVFTFGKINELAKAGR
ncbi:DUF4359 domain-containing protein [Mucilaginibacter sp. AK015]|uniref:DUF4359 domain-containing protein n=1 Tax=Mucilaginibacter sp. AK015 TaxID=2723072 RepID=UPI00161D9A00|nr:DUF4359 domain-containing protein [Mucilaginibacter sp. AK015]MBB5397300.1 RsiW-degrading membrane proteinase PrsW (M82 family) [Mucilaginibacter sp. AK015]